MKWLRRKRDWWPILPLQPGSVCAFEVDGKPVLFRINYIHHFADGETSVSLQDDVTWTRRSSLDGGAP